jgi:hypothetical protein
MLAVMKAFSESKRDPSMAAINAIVREALTAEEIAGLPPAPEVPGEGKVSDNPVIAWSAFLLWASLSGEL